VFIYIVTTVWSSLL